MNHYKLLSLLIVMSAFMAFGCSGGSNKTTDEFFTHMQSKGYEIKDRFDLAANPSTAPIANKLGGKATTVRINGLSVMIAETPSASRAKHMVKIEERGRKMMPNLPAEVANENIMDIPHANGNLLLYIKSDKLNTPEAQSMLRDFMAL